MDVGLLQPFCDLQQTSPPGLHDSSAPQKMVPLLGGGAEAVPVSSSLSLEPASELEPPTLEEPELDGGKSSVVREERDPVTSGEPALFDIGSAPNCDLPGGSNNSVLLAPPHAEAARIIRDSDGARTGRSFIEAEC